MFFSASLARASARSSCSMMTRFAGTVSRSAGIPSWRSRPGAHPRSRKEALRRLVLLRLVHLPIAETEHQAESRLQGDLEIPELYFDGMLPLLTASPLRHAAVRSIAANTTQNPGLCPAR
jgi:hypothetical protein